MSQYGIPSASRTFDVIRDEDDVVLIWSPTEDALFQPANARKLGRLLIEMADRIDAAE